MSKESAISIRVDGELKKESERIMAEFGLNMTTTVNMLLRQIVRERAIPLSLNMNTEQKLRDDLLFAQAERMAGFIGTEGDIVADKMDAIVDGYENG